MRNNRNTERRLALLCGLAALIGLLLAIRVFDGNFAWKAIGMMEVWSGLDALVYYWFTAKWIKAGRDGLISSRWYFIVMVHCFLAAILGLLYMGPAYKVYDNTQQLGILVLILALPLLMLFQYFAGPRHIFRKRMIKLTMGITLLYLLVLFALGDMGHPLGIGTGVVPYPYLNYAQLGWGIVSVNLVVIVIIEYILCRIMIAIDRSGRNEINSRKGGRR